MKVDPSTRAGSFLLSTGARLGGGLVRGLGALCRYRLVQGREILETLQNRGEPVILSFWHEGIVLAAPFFLRHFERGGLPFTVLASQSRDGELVARLAAIWGLPVVRGSASRGGRSALRGTYRAIVHDRRSPLLIPDGPRGPAHRFKVGVAVLAQMSGAAILPLAFVPRHERRLRSWDRLRIALPSSRIDVAVGEPQAVQRGLAAEDLERRRSEIEESISSLHRALGDPGLADVPAAR